MKDKILVDGPLEGEIEIYPSFRKIELELLRQQLINCRLISLLEGLIIQADNYSGPLSDELAETFRLIYGVEEI